MHYRKGSITEKTMLENKEKDEFSDDLYSTKGMMENNEEKPHGLVIHEILDTTIKLHTLEGLNNDNKTDEMSISLINTPEKMKKKLKKS